VVVLLLDVYNLACRQGWINEREAHQAGTCGEVRGWGGTVSFKANFASI